MNRGICQGLPVNEEIHLLAAVQRCRKRGAVLQANLNGVGNVSRIFFAPERKVLVWCLPAQKKVPVRILDDIAQLIGGFSAGVQASHQSAHARSREIIDGDVMLLEPQQHANVRFAQGATPLESNADGWARLGGLRLWFYGRRG